MANTIATNTGMPSAPTGASPIRKETHMPYEKLQFKVRSTPATQAMPDGSPAAPGRTASHSQFRKARALLGSEWALLRRNRMLMATAIMSPLLIPLWANSLAESSNMPPLTAATMLLSLLISTTLLTATYFNVLSTYVSRRQDMVLKRLRTGECSDATILISAASPAVLLSLAALGVGLAMSSFLFELPLPKYPELAIVGIALGTAVIAGIGALTAIVTRTTESAGVTYLPFFVVGFLATNGLLPLSSMPAWAEQALLLVPTNAVTVIAQYGWLGIDNNEASLSRLGALLESLPAFASLAVWCVVIAVIVRAAFRWDPRA